MLPLHVIHVPLQWVETVQLGRPVTEHETGPDGGYSTDSGNCAVVTARAAVAGSDRQHFLESSEIVDRDGDE